MEPEPGLEKPRSGKGGRRSAAAQARSLLERRYNEELPEEGSVNKLSSSSSAEGFYSEAGLGISTKWDAVSKVTHKKFK